MELSPRHSLLSIVLLLLVLPASVHRSVLHVIFLSFCCLFIVIIFHFDYVQICHHVHVYVIMVFLSW